MKKLLLGLSLLSLSLVNSTHTILDNTPFVMPEFSASPDLTFEQIVELLKANGYVVTTAQKIAEKVASEGKNSLLKQGYTLLAPLKISNETTVAWLQSALKKSTRTLGVWVAQNPGYAAAIGLIASYTAFELYKTANKRLVYCQESMDQTATQLTRLGAAGQLTSQNLREDIDRSKTMRWTLRLPLSPIDLLSCLWERLVSLRVQNA